jgi:hypothetical protein
MSKSPLLSWCVLVAVMALAMACRGGITGPAGLKDARLANDPDGNQPTTVFAQDATFYFLAELVDAPPTTRVKATWTALEVDGAQLNLSIDEAEITSGSGLLQFKLDNNELWPAGRYKVDLYLDDQLVRTLEFQVEETGLAAAVPNAPASLPAAEELAAPVPEATEPPEELPSPELSITSPPTEEASSPEALATSPPTREVRSSVGDTLNSAAPAAGSTPLPMESYVHPSGAFTLLVPVGWPVMNEDETSIRLGNDQSSVGAVFADVGVVYTETQLQDFIDSFAVSFVETFATDYRVIEQKSQVDGSTYLTMSYSSGDKTGDVDFLFSQQGNVIFVLYFVTSVYDEMRSTWNVILNSYQVYPQTITPTPAPTLPATTPGPAPALATATALPPPTSTPAPLINQFAPPPGRARLYVVNQYQAEVALAINGTENKIPAENEVPIDLDVGQYTYTINFPDKAIEGQVAMAPDQSWAILIDKEGNVYYAQQIYP